MQLLREIIMRLDLNEGIDEFVSKSKESLEQIVERLETQIAEIKMRYQYSSDNLSFQYP